MIRKVMTQLTGMVVQLQQQKLVCSQFCINLLLVHYITDMFMKILHFLRAKAECFAHLCHRLGVCSSVRLSVCHTHELYQNSAS